MKFPEVEAMQDSNPTSERLREYIKAEDETGCEERQMKQEATDRADHHTKGRRGRGRGENEAPVNAEKMDSGRIQLVTGGHHIDTHNQYQIRL